MRRSRRALATLRRWNAWLDDSLVGAALGVLSIFVGVAAAMILLAGVT